MVLTENQWLELVPGVSTEAQVLAVMGEPEIKGTASYGSLQKLDILSYSAMASYFFRAGKLQIISVTPDEDKNGLSSKAQTWLAALGDQMRERTMRSHVGKNTLLHLYPRRGLALHVVGDIVEDVEIFPTLSLDNYMKYLYKKPPVFIK